jgi:hypothetical protein
MTSLYLKIPMFCHYHLNSEKLTQSLAKPFVKFQYENKPICLGSTTGTLKVKNYWNLLTPSTLFNWEWIITLKDWWQPSSLLYGKNS